MSTDDGYSTNKSLSLSAGGEMGEPNESDPLIRNEIDGNDTEHLNTTELIQKNDDISKWRRYVAVGILFYVQLLNYVDRYTVAGVLIEISDYFNLDNSSSGLLQTVFFGGYLLFAPLFGYLGDRYNRIAVMVFGIVIWSGATLCSSFVNDKRYFFVLRGLVGVGEASYIAISPTLIGDMFIGPQRTRMLAIFFSAIPIGGGLGYVVGSWLSKALGGWQWAFRITPIFGVLAILLLVFLLPNPRRGALETNISVDQKNNYSYKDDLIYLLLNKSFVYLTLGNSFVYFMIGTYTLWGPTYFAYAQITIGNLEPCSSGNCTYVGISVLFGLTTSLGGLVGVVVGAEIARKWKLRGRLDADPLVCAIGVFTGVPLVLFGLFSSMLSFPFACFLFFLAISTISFTWALVGDISLAVVEPCRRATASSVSLLVCHLLGDASSPYITGLLSDHLAIGRLDTYFTKYVTLEQALFISLFMLVIGGGMFLLLSLYIVDDKRKVEKKMENLTLLINPNE